MTSILRCRMSLIQKNIQSALQYVKSLFKGSIDALERCPVEVAEARLVDQDRGVAIDCKASWHDVWSLQRYNRIPEFEFCKDGNKFTVPENAAFVSTNNDLDAEKFQPASISISRFYSTDIDWNKPHYFRSVQPLERFDWAHTFHTFGYEEKYPRGGTYFSLGLMEVDFKDNGIFHLYPYKCGDQYYLICEAKFECTVEEFNEYAFAAQLSLGFFTDRVALDEVYILFYADNTFLQPEGVYYYEMRPSIKGQYPIFTTNMYWLHEILKDGKNNSYADKEVASDGVVDNNVVKCLEMDFYSRMANELYCHEELRRAACTILDASTEVLEYQAALYAVALECLASFLLREQGGTSALPADPKIFNKDIRPAFENILKEAEAAGKIDKGGSKILGNRLNHLNGATNSGRLTDPFTHFGYTLSEIEKDAINSRNRLLHGGIFSGANYSAQFDELYKCSLRLHKLCCILLLKRVGFDSWIINLPVLHGFADECIAAEPVLLRL